MLHIDRAARVAYEGVANEDAIHRVRLIVCIEVEGDGGFVLARGVEDILEDDVLHIRAVILMRAAGFRRDNSVDLVGGVDIAEVGVHELLVQYNGGVGSCVEIGCVNAPNVAHLALHLLNPAVLTYSHQGVGGFR